MDSTFSLFLTLVLQLWCTAASMTVPRCLQKHSLWVLDQMEIYEMYSRASVTVPSGVQEYCYLQIPTKLLKIDIKGPSCSWEGLMCWTLKYSFTASFRPISILYLVNLILRCLLSIQKAAAGVLTMSSRPYALY